MRVMTGCAEPDCDLPAEIVTTWLWPSTDGPALHGLTRCAARHNLTIRLDT